MPYIFEFSTVIETPRFSAKAGVLWTEAEREDLAVFIARYPTAGDVIQGSGGIRKLRWRIAGSGKRSGVRIIYFYKSKNDEVWLLTAYRKNEVETIPTHELRRIRKSIDEQ